MILDTSAIIAVVMGEPERAAFIEVILDAPTVRIGAPTFVETCLVFEHQRRGTRELLERWLGSVEAEILAFEHQHAETARDAFLRFGRSSGHPARLNFGDCLTYASAIVANEPLLYKGNDFRLTDVPSVMPA